jgi:hypothetical protein
MCLLLIFDLEDVEIKKGPNLTFWKWHIRGTVISSPISQQSLMRGNKLIV